MEHSDGRQSACSERSITNLGRKRTCRDRMEHSDGRQSAFSEMKIPNPGQEWSYCDRMEHSDGRQNACLQEPYDEGEVRRGAQGRRGGQIRLFRSRGIGKIKCILIGTLGSSPIRKLDLSNYRAKVCLIVEACTFRPFALRYTEIRSIFVAIIRLYSLIKTDSDGNDEKISDRHPDVLTSYS